MSAFSSIDIARTGAGFSSYWLDTIAHNVANVNSVREGEAEPFRQRMVLAQSVGARTAGGAGGGVGVRGVAELDGEPTRVQEPDHPLADADGMVTKPHVRLDGQLTDLILATRGYQASIKAMESGREAYEAALSLGR